MKTVDKEKLWEAFQKKPTPEIREQIIIEYAPLVKVVAGRLSMYLGNNVEFDDLVSYGVFGLIDAIDKFDLGKDGGRCVSVCPMGLQPLYLYRFSRCRDVGMLRQYSILDCVECGCCAYTCPGKLPIVAAIREGKQRVREEPS